MNQDFVPIFIIIFIAIVFAGILSLVAYYLGPKQQSEVKAKPFESGLEPKVSDNKQRVKVKFYLVAMIFLIFDVEVLFLYPYAVIFKKLGWNGFMIISVFLMMLIVGILYEWKKGALEWE